MRLERPVERRDAPSRLLNHVDPLPRREVRPGRRDAVLRVAHEVHEVQHPVGHRAEGEVVLDGHDAPGHADNLAQDLQRYRQQSCSTSIMVTASKERAGRADPARRGPGSTGMIAGWRTTTSTPWCFFAPTRSTTRGRCCRPRCRRRAATRRDRCASRPTPSTHSPWGCSSSCSQVVAQRTRFALSRIMAGRSSLPLGAPARRRAPRPCPARGSRLPAAVAEHGRGLDPCGADGRARHRARRFASRYTCRARLSC